MFDEVQRCRANLLGADFSGADLKKAMLDQTQFDEAKAFTEDINEMDLDKRLEAQEQRLASVALYAAAAA